MGFDLYGEKPIQNEFKHQERWDELSSMSYDEREEKGLSDEYYTLMSKYESVNPGAYTCVNSTPVRGSNTRYSFWVQSSDAYPNASQYLDIDIANASMYRVLIKGSHSSDTADIAQFLIYGLANNDGARPPVIEQLDTTPPSFNGDSGSYSPDFHRNSGSFSCIVKGFGTSGCTRGSLGTYGTTLRFQYSGSNNQGLLAFIERWD